MDIIAKRNYIIEKSYNYIYNYKMKVKYPIFIEAATWTNIDYWKEVFNQCSLGKFPKGMSLSKNIIYINNVKTKRTIEKYQLPSDPKEICQLCKEIFTTHLDLKSTQDLKNELDNFTNNQEEYVQKEFTVFKDATLKIQKEELIDQYVVSIDNMNIEDSKRLKNMIYIGHFMDKIEIQIDNNKIVKIVGLKMSFKNNKWTFIFK